MADQNVAVKKADPLLRSLVRPSPHLLRSRSPPEERPTNDQRNVNRKPREATLINPTEINCCAQQRSSIPLSLARRTSSSFVFAQTDSTALGGLLKKYYTEAA